MEVGKRATTGRQWLVFFAALVGLALLYGEPRIVIGVLLAVVVLGLGLFAIACLASGFAQADANRPLRRPDAAGSRLPWPRKSACW